MPATPAGASLPSLLRQGLRSHGFDWEDASSPVIHASVWWRPPLATNCELSGVPLQQHLFPRVARDTDDLVAAYENLIWGTLRSHRIKSCPVAWLARTIGVSPVVASRIFGPHPGYSNRLAVYLHLIQLAALIYTQAEEARLQEGPDTFYVTTGEGYKLGVLRGRLVSNNPRNKAALGVKGLHHPTGLQEMARGRPAKLSLAEQNLLDHTLGWVWEHVPEGEREGYRIALQVLRWRAAGDDRALREFLIRSKSEKALKLALAEAKEHRGYTDPYTALREILIPRHVREGEFKKLFGGRPKYGLVSVETRERWDRAIETLAPIDRGDE